MTPDNVPHLRDRFVEASKFVESTDCIEHRNKPSKNGAAQIRVKIDGVWKTKSVTWVAWFLAYGEALVDRYLFRQCENPRCVNPDHLWPIRSGEPLPHLTRRQREYRERLRRGEPSSPGVGSLTEEQVINIRHLRAKGKPLHHLIAEYRVSGMAIYAAASGRRHKYLNATHPGRLATKEERRANVVAAIERRRRHGNS